MNFMEIDQLKSAWSNMGNDNKNRDSLKRMLNENRHPVLKGIRLQLLVEIIAWTLFLFFYYDALDGGRKPIYVNVLLVAAVVFLLGHSLVGYFSSKFLIKGSNLQQSLERYLFVLKKFALLAVATRVFTIICLFIFLSATIHFTPYKFGLLAVLVFLVAIQVLFLSRIWNHRIKKIQATINGLSEAD